MMRIQILTNEIQTLNQVSNIVTLSLGGGSIDINDNDADATNEFNTSATLLGTDLNITDGGGTLIVDLSSLGGGGNPTDELNTNFVLNGTDLELTDAGGTLIVDLSALGGGGNPTDELNTNLVLNGTDLELTDAGGTLIVDLSPLSTGGYSVGQLFGGGVIIWVDSTGQHGLIAGLTDISASVEFEAVPNQATLFASDFTDGQPNTTTLVSGAGAPHGFTAAALCDGYSFNGFNDWYLPSLYELELMLQNNYAMGDYALGWATATWYWSSTEDPAAVGFFAYRARRNLGVLEIESTSETNTAAVRPIRAF